MAWMALSDVGLLSANSSSRTPVSAIRLDAVCMSASCPVATRRENTLGITYVCDLTVSRCWPHLWALFHKRRLRLLPLKSAKMMENPTSLGNPNSVKSINIAWALFVVRWQKDALPAGLNLLSRLLALRSWSNRTSKR